MTARDAAGNVSQPSAAVTATTLAVLPAAPSGLAAAAASSHQINLTWADNSSSESGFKIERKVGPAGTYAQIAVTAPNAASFGDTTAASSTLYYYRVRATNAAGDSAYTNEASAVSAIDPTETPFGGSPVAATARIEAENFDNGPEGVAYHDTTPGNSGGAYRSTGVDISRTIFDSGGGYNVTATAPGEWLKYTIKVASSGTYSLAVRGAAAGAGGKFHVEIDGVDQTGPLSIPNTYFSQFFTTVTKTGVFLSAGIHVMRLSMDSGGADGTAGSFNWLQFTQTATAAAPRSRRRPFYRRPHHRRPSSGRQP